MSFHISLKFSCLTMSQRRMCTNVLFLCCLVIIVYKLAIVGKQHFENSMSQSTDMRNREILRNEVKTTAGKQLTKEESGTLDLKSSTILYKSTSIIGKQKRTKRKYDIVLSAYQRSGSSATGRLLSQRDTFYIYEPLWLVATHTFYKGPCLFCKDFAYSYKNNCIKVSKNCPNTTSSLRELVSPVRNNGSSNNESDIWDVYHKTREESLAFLQSIFKCRFHQFPKFFYNPDNPSS